MGSTVPWGRTLAYNAVFFVGYDLLSVLVSVGIPDGKLNLLVGEG
jgi:hypothetical protein